MNEIVFVTSNNEKLANVRYLSRNYDVFIAKQKYYGVGYKEPRVCDRQELFDKSIQDARDRWQKYVSGAEEKIFFIEDTSVNIPALAKGDKEFPGLEIKYWMKENDFYSIDQQLKNAGNNRKAIVRSDVALVFSSSLEKRIGKPYEIFTSQVEGKIVDEEINIKTQPYYCWLNDKTFNKWFVPDTCQMPLSALPIEVADKYDFRKGSILNMLTFLEQQGIIKKKSYRSSPNIQLSFFLPPVFIITGPTCAGKTTIAEYLLKEFNYYHLEASDFMYVRYREHHGTNSLIKIADFAERALLIDPGVVVDQINRILKQNTGIPKVITGLRSPNEIEEFIKKYDNEFPIEVIYIDASFENRYIRNRIRNRDQEAISREDFKLLDDQQQRMGLSSILSTYNGNVVENNSSKRDYYKTFLDKYRDKISKRSDKAILGRKLDLLSLGKNLEDIIILSLYRSDNKIYYTTTQISHLIENHFSTIVKNKNNISRYFNQNYYPYYDIIKEKGKNLYRLSQTGLSRARLLDIIEKKN
ncbi:MAG: hypothetical protein C0417_08270 [Chlorobiaceae bacterium]|nr:hypothetical protein [Chlorobiaceae bacterium]